ncbi:MAG: amidohydrolase family protein, partial [Pseudonocardiaceae bacterium]
SGMPLPDGCDVVDFPDATLLPGLIDTHVHLCGDGGHGALDRLPTFSAEEMTAVIEGSLRAHLASGVTTVRDLGDRSWAVIDWRDRNRGDTGMPSVLASGAPITSPGGHCWNMVGQARGVDELCRAVQHRTERGCAWCPARTVERISFAVEHGLEIAVRAAVCPDPPPARPPPPADSTPAAASPGVAYGAAALSVHGGARSAASCWDHSPAMVGGVRLEQTEVPQVGDVFVDQWRREMGNVFFGADFGRAYCGVEHLCCGGAASDRLLGLLVGVE